MKVMSSSQSEMEVCWEPDGGGEGEKEGKGEEEEQCISPGLN